MYPEDRQEKLRMMAALSRAALKGGIPPPPPPPPPRPYELWYGGKLVSTHENAQDLVEEIDKIVGLNTINQRFDRRLLTALGPSTVEA